MKKVILSLVAVVAAMTVNAQTVTLLKNDVVVDTYPASEVDKVVFNNTQLIEANGHAYVDLGITDAQGNPIYFSNCNLNETTPDAQEADYGTYYKGQTSDKANEVLGGTWTMNSKEAYEKLFASNGVVFDYNNVNAGHKGLKISKVGDPSKYIFIPYAGNIDLSNSQLFNDGEHAWIQLDEEGTEYLHVYKYKFAPGEGYEFLSGSSAAFYAARQTSIRPVLVVQ